MKHLILILVFLLTIPVLLGQIRSRYVFTIPTTNSFDYSDEQLTSFVMGRYNVFVGTRTSYEISQLKELNSEARFFWYHNTAYIFTNDPRYQAAENIGLIWKDVNGNPVTASNPNAHLLDVRHSAFIPETLNSMQQSMTYHDGVLLDTFGVKGFSSQPGQAGYPVGYDQYEYYQKLRDTLEAVRDTYPDTQIVINGYSQNIEDRSLSGMSLTDLCDSIIVEGFPHKPDGYVGSYKVRMILQELQALVNMGRGVTIEQDGLATEYDKRILGFAIAVALDKDTGFTNLVDYVYAHRGQDYVPIRIYPELFIRSQFRAVDVAYTQNNLIVRELTNGYVIINITDSSLPVDLSLIDRPVEQMILSGDGQWPDYGAVFWQPISGIIQLEGASALVLRYAPQVYES